MSVIGDRSLAVPLSKPITFFSSTDRIILLSQSRLHAATQRSRDVWVNSLKSKSLSVYRDSCKAAYIAAESLYVCTCMYVCPKIYTRRALSKKSHSRAAVSDKQRRLQFSGRLNRSVDKSAERRENGRLCVVQSHLVLRRDGTGTVSLYVLPLKWSDNTCII